MHAGSGPWADAVRTEHCLSSSAFIRNVCPFKRGSGLHDDLLVSGFGFYPSLLVTFITRDGTRDPPLPLRCFPGLRSFVSFEKTACSPYYQESRHSQGAVFVKLGKLQLCFMSLAFGNGPGPDCSPMSSINLLPTSTGRILTGLLPVKRLLLTCS